MVGNHYLYISPDGNFVFGGSPLGYDMFVGVKAGRGAPPISTAFTIRPESIWASTSSGVIRIAISDRSTPTPAASQAQALGHQRQLEWIYSGAPIDLTYVDSYKFNSDGSSDDTGTNFSTGQHYLFGNSGAIRIGVGQIPVAGYLGISVALQAPSLSGGGVYLNPTGILNSANSALFTASISPGELITLNGTGLAPSAAVTTNFGSSLNGVQVLMNGTPRRSIMSTRP